MKSQGAPSCLAKARVPVVLLTLHHAVTSSYLCIGCDSDSVLVHKQPQDVNFAHKQTFDKAEPHESARCLSSAQSSRSSRGVAVSLQHLSLRPAVCQMD
jgi:hypothetical protein